MKSNYKRLKRTILIRTGLVALLTFILGAGIVHFFIEETFQEYKYLFLGIGFLLLYFIFYRIVVKLLLHYLGSIEGAIDAIQKEEEGSVKLERELKPIADKLDTLKVTLKNKEMERITSEQKKNDLVVYLAHDLKTPLTSVVAYLTMLDERKNMPEEDREKYIHVTLEKANRLRELINEFFEITRFNLQDIVLDKKQLNLSMMLEQLADESYGMLREKYLTCSVHTDDNLMVLGDPDKLARVFDNLLRNAIAYSYTDTEIRIEAYKMNGEIVIRFTNHGHEIPQQKLQAIFEKFYRVDNARSSQTGGAGLGLSIAKRIVELHGGQIEASSEWEYTTFTVYLPCAEQQRPVRRRRRSTGENRNKRVVR
ncbi:MAG: sensor histidine kinase [Muricoprocola sp.]